MTELSPLPDRAVASLEHRLASQLDLRRDLYLLVEFVRREGLKRSYRNNAIPKGPALKLAKLLSWAPEAESVQRNNEGGWSDIVSRVARELGLVSFDIKGRYAGYSSSEPSFPDNEIVVDDKRMAEWVASEPLAKERAILDKLVEITPSEFFHSSSVFTDFDRFDSFGCAVGPASRIHLPSVRNALLKMLADLPAGVWLPMAGWIEHVKATAPRLILSPELQRRPLSDWEEKTRKLGRRIDNEIEELYSNFREHEGKWGTGDKRHQLTAKTPDVFVRVEGRYLQYFLQEIPVLCSFVDLAMAPRKVGKDALSPSLESVRAFRLSPRLRQVVHGDPEIQKVRVTVLPNFDVHVEAQSWPDRELAALDPLCVMLKEDPPTYQLHIDRKKVLGFVASNPEAPPVKLALERMSCRPLPDNVAGELESWCGHAEKLTIFEGVALVELRGPEAAQVRSELGALVAEDRAKGFVLARNPAQTIAVLEQRQRVPTVVRHSAGRFGVCEGPLGSPLPQPKRAPAPAAPRRVELVMEDLVGYRSEDADALTALHKAMAQAGSACQLLDRGKLLLVRAEDLASFRSMLKRLDDKLDVQIERRVPSEDH
ncbi:MAG: hypothetical protein HY898_23265 [Deltaproteobacteria bacterium]|nr:hypothetical protein [Deltaproteobacteria bacterium]